MTTTATQITGYYTSSEYWGDTTVWLGDDAREHARADAIECGWFRADGSDAEAVDKDGQSVDEFLDETLEPLPEDAETLRWLADHASTPEDAAALRNAADAAMVVDTRFTLDDDGTIRVSMWRTASHHNEQPDADGAITAMPLRGLEDDAIETYMCGSTDEENAIIARALAVWLDKQFPARA